MSVPLATLRRHSQLVWLHDPMGWRAPPPRPAASGAARRDAFTALTPLDATAGRPVQFRHADDARSYLQFWKGEGSAMTSLRYALQKCEPSAPVFSWSDDEVLLRLAGRIARGAVLLIEAARPPGRASLPAAPATPAPVEPPAVPVAQVLAGVKPPAPPLLPILEEVQIEGAEVLPEIEQTLEQVELTIGEIKVAPVSLEPTPSKVPDIEKTMTEAGASVNETLDKL